MCRIFRCAHASLWLWHTTTAGTPAPGLVGSVISVGSTAPQQQDPSSPTGVRTCVPCIERQTLNHWTTTEDLVPQVFEVVFFPQSQATPLCCSIWVISIFLLTSNWLPPLSTPICCWTHTPILFFGFFFFFWLMYFYLLNFHVVFFFISFISLLRLLIFSFISSTFIIVPWRIFFMAASSLLADNSNAPAISSIVSMPYRFFIRVAIFPVGLMNELHLGSGDVLRC